MKKLLLTVLCVFCVTPVFAGSKLLPQDITLVQRQRSPQLFVSRIDRDRTAIEAVCLYDSPVPQAPEPQPLTRRELRELKRLEQLGSVGRQTRAPQLLNLAGELSTWFMSTDRKYELTRNDFGRFMAGQCTWSLGCP